jgi:drug/metabolite transporter (DMT)-like permease
LSAVLLPPPSPVKRLMSAPIKATLLMLGVALLWAIATPITREAAAELPAFQIVFIRNIISALLLLPTILRDGGGLWTRHVGRHLVNSAGQVVAMTAWIAGVALAPLNEATALSFSSPLFATAGAALFLGEKVRIRRWSATLLGFAGVLVVLRPGFIEPNFGLGFVLASAASFSIVALNMKTLSKTESGERIVFFMSLFLIPMSLPGALLFWQPMTLAGFGWITAIAVIGVVSHVMLARALALADASAVLPIDFTRLIFTAILAYWLYDEMSDIWTWAGAALIFASAVYIAQREAMLARQRMAAIPEPMPPRL